MWTVLRSKNKNKFYNELQIWQLENAKHLSMTYIYQYLRLSWVTYMWKTTTFIWVLPVSYLHAKQ